jgi:hypothetical protein
LYFLAARDVFIRKAITTNILIYFMLNKVDRPFLVRSEEESDEHNSKPNIGSCGKVG